MEKEGRESWKFYKFDILGLKGVLEKDFEALRGAELMKMRCRSVWDRSRGPKPAKMTENPEKSAASAVRPLQSKMR